MTPEDSTQQRSDDEHILPAGYKSWQEYAIYLEHLSGTDVLTGVKNRRAFMDHLGEEVAYANRHHDPLTVAILDIDRFKDVNDAYGHGEGDKVLREVSRYVKNGLRKEDIFGRLGGEEFGIIMRSTQEDDAYRVVDRIRNSFVDNYPTLREQKKLQPKNITFSGGITSYREEEDTITSMLDRADQALYRAKDLGRNQIVKAA